MLTIAARLVGTPKTAQAVFELSDFHPDAPPRAGGGPKTWSAARRLTGSAADEAALAALVFIASKDWDGSGEIDPDEVVIQAAVGDIAVGSNGQAGEFDFALMIGDRILGRPLIPGSFFSWPGAVARIDYGGLPYDAPTSWKDRVIAGGPELHGSQLSQFHAFLNGVSVSKAIQNTHATSGQDLTIGRSRAAVAMIHGRARDRLLRELRVRSAYEGLRPSHFIVLGENGEWRPWTVLEDGRVSREVHGNSPWGAGDPEHATRTTDELGTLGMATGDPFARFAIHGALQHLMTFPEWDPRNGPKMKRPLSARMMGWTLKALKAGVDLHGDAYREDWMRVLRGAHAFLGETPRGMPFGFPTAALGDHAGPSLEQLRWYWTEYEHGPKREWDPAWDAWVENGGDAWELFRSGPMRGPLEDAGREDHGSKWAYWGEGRLEPGAPAGADALLHGIGIEEFFSHASIWMQAIELDGVVDAIDELGDESPKWLRDTAKHLISAVLLGRVGRYGFPHASETSSKTFFRDLQLRGGGVGREPNPYQTLDGYCAEALAHARRVLKLGSNFNVFIDEAVEAVVSESEGASLSDPARLVDTFWEAMRLS